MKDYFKLKTWLITAAMVLTALLLAAVLVYYEFGLKKNIKITSASADNNVSGWAWSSNIGWISFNCTGDSPACGASNYGVSIDSASGDFSGYGWSSNVGWISFNRSDTGNPPSQPYKNDSGNDPIAKHNSGNGQVDGWAKILSLGDNGWVKLRKFSSDSGADYGVSIVNGNFSGWAWNGNDDGSGIGWVSFNCDHTNDGTLPPNNINACGTSNYRVVLAGTNHPPSVANMTAPNLNYSAASVNALRANLQFDFIDSDAGSFGSAYQLEIRKSQDNQLVLNTGVCTDFETPSADCKIDNSICMRNESAGGCLSPGDCVCQYPLEEGLNYETRYKWSVKVWDNFGASGEAEYDTDQDTDNDDGIRKTFTTYKHEMPDVNFTWFLANPSQGEEVKFTDQSKVYSAQPDINPADCTDALCDWEWSSISPGVTFKDSVNGPAPIIIFSQAGNPTITLKVTDFDGYIIYRSKTINVNANLPGWREVKPE